MVFLTVRGGNPADLQQIFREPEKNPWNLTRIMPA